VLVIRLRVDDMGSTEAELGVVVGRRVLVQQVPEIGGRVVVG
jgi:hypothetical protein